jgi:uncharacterized protein YggE
MQSFTLRIGAIIAVAILALAAVVSPIAFGRTGQPIALAQDAPDTPARTITVVGEGKVNVQPDVARVNIGVETVKPTVEEASEENDAIVNAVLAALKEQGIADNDIQTSGFSVYAERFGPDGPLPEGEVRYRVSNNVGVKIRDMEKVGEVIDAAMQAGANNIYGVEFTLEDKTDAQSEARALAVDAAKAKAEELAALNGVSVGEVLAISEVIGNSMFISANQAYMPMGGGGGAPIAPGELELSTQLQITYAIAD